MQYLGAMAELQEKFAKQREKFLQNGSNATIRSHMGLLGRSSSEMCIHSLVMEIAFANDEISNGVEVEAHFIVEHSLGGWNVSREVHLSSQIESYRVLFSETDDILDFDVLLGNILTSGESLLIALENRLDSISLRLTPKETPGESTS